MTGQPGLNFETADLVPHQSAVAEEHLKSRLTISAAILLTLALNLFGHAVLEKVSPAAESIVSGPDVAFTLQFNTKIDPAQSRLELVTPSKDAVVLKLDERQPTGALGAHTKGLQPGRYKLRWQVLAVDGHITRGEVPFSVK